MGMVGRVMPMQVTGRLLVGFAIVMAVAMLSDFLCNEHGVPGSFRSRNRQRVMGRGQRKRSGCQADRNQGHSHLPVPTPEPGQRDYDGFKNHQNGSHGQETTGAPAPSLPRCY